MRRCLENSCSVDGSDSKPEKHQYLDKDSLSILEEPEGPEVGLQLTQPKLQNKQQKAPETTNQACRPPSGKEEGSKPAKAGFGCSLLLAFSRSDSGRSDVSGRMLASVSGRPPLLESESE